MKKLTYIALALTLLPFIGCQKEIPQDILDEQQVVSIKIENKLAEIDPEFQEDSSEADYCLLMIINNGSSKSHYLQASSSENNIILESLELMPGEYKVQECILFNDAGTPDDKSDDFMVSAAPHRDSEFGNLTENSLELGFTVHAGVDNQLNLTVFEHDPLKNDWYRWYGFIWFVPEITKLKEALFYGDFCSDNFTAYAGSKYGDYPMVDMPAIFRIKIFQDQDGDGKYETRLGNYNNEENYLSIKDEAYVPPLSIVYVDGESSEDHYKLQVSIYDIIGLDEITQEVVYGYKVFENWYFTDSADIVYKDPAYRDSPSGIESFGPGKDGIFDFIVGGCTVLEWDVTVTDPDFETETAYAYYSENSSCFIELGFSRWGWSNKLTNAEGAHYELPIWAGAGQCDTEKGTLVGHLIVSIGDENFATVAFKMIDGYTLDETHLYVGEDILPLNKGNYTVASGKFPHKHKNLNSSSYDLYEVFLPVGEFHIIAHSVVNGQF